MRIAYKIGLVGLVATGLCSSSEQAAENRCSRLWIASSAVLIAANAADAMSSMNLREHNPLLRRPDGSFDPRKAVLVKSATTGGILLIQWLIQRKNRKAHYDRPFSVINFSLAGAVAGVTVRNYRIHP